MIDLESSIRHEKKKQQSVDSLAILCLSLRATMTVVSSYTIATVLSLQTLSTCIIFTLGQYIYSYYLQLYPYYSNTTVIHFHSTQKNLSDKCLKTSLSLDSTAQAWAQQKSADLFFWTNFWSCIPIIVMTYILGYYTPKLGRRFVLLLPMIGTTIQLIIWLTIIYSNLPEYWWYIAAFLVGLSGSDNVRSKSKLNNRSLFCFFLNKFSILDFVLNLFITENTHEHERSTHFVLFGAISMIVSAIGTFAIGYYIAWQGFNDLYWTALILQIMSIFIVVFFFKSDRHRTLPSASNRLNKHSTSNCFDICTVFSFKHRSQKKSLALLLTLLAYASYSFIYTAFIVLLLYLLNAPFCWSSKQIGNYSAAALICFGALSMLGMKILTRLGASDTMICILSHVFFILASLWTAFAQYTWQMYVGLILCSFGGYQHLLTMSMISKWLEPYERTNAFTLVTEINTIMKVLGYCIFNWIYARTVVNYKNFTFLLAAALAFIPLISNM